MHLTELRRRIVLARVRPQFAVQAKGGRTLGAHVRLVADVRSLVLDEIVALRKRSIAKGAFVGFLAGVRSHVPFHVVRVVEAHVARVTLVRPFASVDAPVFDQRIGFGERGAADVADERLEAGVGGQVRFEAAWIGT